jgi:ABC-2 type transport system ATP-binding protein
MLDVDHVGMVYRPMRGALRWIVQTANREPVRALHDVSFQVERGEVVGIVGPNGAGKSTLIRAIATLLIPTDGEIRLNGVRLDPDRPELRAQVGLLLPEERSFYWRLTGRQNLDYFAAMAGLDRHTAETRIEQALARHELVDRDKSLFGYSSGMLARLGMARALLHDPALLILDEPTRSLDPIAGLDFCRQVRAIAADGRAVLLASHRLDEVVQACDRVFALIDGEIKWEGTSDEIAGDPAGLGRRLAQLVDISTGGEFSR